jgi:hypothetical protein
VPHASDASRLAHIKLKNDTAALRSPLRDDVVRACVDT